MKMKLLAAAIGAASLVTAGGASAAIVLSDNFDAEVADQLNWAGDSVFLSTGAPGSVDLIGVGGIYDFHPGHGSYVDLDGSTGSGHDPAGELTSIAAFGAGKYTLSFLLAGNARGQVARTTRVSLGDFSVDILLSSADPFSGYSFTFITTGGQLKFTQLGESNQQGNLLDDVVLATGGRAGGIPEPGAWALMILGFGGVGGMLRRRRPALTVA